MAGTEEVREAPVPVNTCGTRRSSATRSRQAAPSEALEERIQHYILRPSWSAVPALAVSGERRPSRTNAQPRQRVHRHNFRRLGHGRGQAPHITCVSRNRRRRCLWSARPGPSTRGDGRTGEGRHPERPDHRRRLTAAAHDDLVPSGSSGPRRGLLPAGRLTRHQRQSGEPFANPCCAAESLRQKKTAVTHHNCR